MNLVPRTIRVLADSTTTTMLTPDQYVQQMGLQCPHCRSAALRCAPMESDAGVAWREVQCGDCRASWVESYGLVGYAGLAVPRSTH